MKNVRLIMVAFLTISTRTYLFWYLVVSSWYLYYIGYQIFISSLTTKYQIPNTYIKLSRYLFLINFATAQSSKGRKLNPKKIMQFLDKNKDGKISRKEAAKSKKKKLAGSFDFIDRNKDGFIDKKELEILSKNRKKTRTK